MLIGALALAGLAVPASFAVYGTGASAEVDTSPAPDTATVMKQAQASGERREDRSQRTETDQVFANPDGTWTEESAPEPVRTQNDDGSWSDIDTTLTKVPGGYAPASAIGDLMISDGGDKTFAQMTVEGKDLDWTLPGTLPEPVIEGNTATYPNIGSGEDLVVTATPSGFRHDIVLRHAPTGPVSFDIPVVTEGSKVSEDADGDLAVKTSTGDELVSASQPVMYDATADSAGQPVHQEDIDTTVTKTSAGAVVTLDPSESFLNNPNTKYPVTIDPTWNATNPNDTWVYDTKPDAIHPYDDSLYAGTPDNGTTRYRSFVAFENGAWVNQSVTAATLTLRNFDSSTCSGAAVQVRKITGSWTPGSATWNNPPPTTATNAVNSSAAFGHSSSCAAADVSWNVTNLVQWWAANPTQNWGFRIAAATETGTGSYRAYRSAGWSYPSAVPRLSVTYNSYPAKPTNLSVGPVANGMVTTSTPQLSAHISDPDGGSVTARFVVYSGATQTQVWSGSGSPVPNAVVGGVSTVVVPAGVLDPGGTYTVTAFGSDGIDLSGDGQPSGSVTSMFTIQGPIAFGGRVPGVTTLDSSLITVYADPSADDGSASPSTQTSLMLPNSVVRTVGNTYYVSLPTSMVPATYTTPDGLVNFYVEIATSMSSLGTASVTVRKAKVVDPSANDIWVNTTDAQFEPASTGSAATVADSEAAPPYDSTESDDIDAAEGDGSVQQGQIAVGGTPLSPVPEMVDVDPEPIATNTAARVETGANGAAVANGAVFGKVASDNPNGIGGCGGGGRILKTWTVEAAIGTTYPTSDSAAYLSFGAKDIVKLGVAYQYYANGPYKYEGDKKSIKYGLTGTYAGRNWGRSYHIGVVYHRQQCGNPVTGAGYVRVVPWEATGADYTSYHTSTIPDWDSNCGRVDPGFKWQRRLENADGDGAHYKLSISVKIKQYIGISLPIDRPYTTSANMTYEIGEGPGTHEMCAISGYPLSAAKVKERLR